MAWWTVYWTFCFRYIAGRLRTAGIPVVLLCHNVIEHESSVWKRHLTLSVFRQAQRFIVHTKEDERNLKQTLPGAQITVHPHPVYNQFPAPTVKLDRRADLELLFYGFVRPYKGLNILLDALALVQTEDIFLTVAGEFWSGERETTEKIRALNLENRVDLRPCYQTDMETAQLFDRADCVVLPYRSATGSGVVTIAYHYNTPVIVTRTGGLPDVVDEGLTGFIVEPESTSSLADGIRRAIGFRPPPENFSAVKDRMSWHSLARAIIMGDYGS
jgi:glycosyltransferase involved in cell wall biosynthesis